MSTSKRASRTQFLPFCGYFPARTMASSFCGSPPERGYNRSMRIALTMPRLVKSCRGVEECRGSRTCLLAPTCQPRDQWHGKHGTAESPGSHAKAQPRRQTTLRLELLHAHLE